MEAQFEVANFFKGVVTNELAYTFAKPEIGALVMGRILVRKSECSLLMGAQVLR